MRFGICGNLGRDLVVRTGVKMVKKLKTGIVQDEGGIVENHRSKEGEETDEDEDSEAGSTEGERSDDKEAQEREVARQIAYPIEEIDHNNWNSEVGNDEGVETVEEENGGDIVSGRMKRRRLPGRMERQRARPSWDDITGMEEWDDESDDDDWAPFGPLKLRLHWFCTNCTMPNSEKFLICGKCGEHRKSGILARGHMSVALHPDKSSTAITETKNNAVPRKDEMPPIPVSSSCVEKSSNMGKRTYIGFDERMLLHYETRMKSHPHPERPDRVKAIVAGIAAAGLFPDRCTAFPSREATLNELTQVHSQQHVDAVEATFRKEASYFTSDTYANKDSALAARIAAGICADLAAAIVKGQTKNGFAVVRPPGHHAEHVTVMGFCLHNNACVAARAAQAAGAKKVLIVDWDVHHGNGTQEILYNDPSVLYISLHRYERGTFYPGTGAAKEVGDGPGVGFSVNIPWICGGIGDNDYIYAVSEIVLPIAKQFGSDLTIISAGFDAAEGDPLGGCKVTPSGYAYMTSMLSSLSEGRMLVILEGGYNLRSISASAAAVVKVLVGDDVGPVPEGIQPSEEGALSMLEVFAVQSKYWSALHTPASLKSIAEVAASKFHAKGKRSRRHHFNGHSRRSHFSGGPIWWKWGRRRAVYNIWVAAIQK